ncbi:hypothetical protein QE447_002862 [Stenotrophomonas sp. SORGH_AS282]|nr:hypothetical protein [Stenotrophomonas sp. SORGH_AS_0282]
MTDDKKNAGSPDRDRINVNEDHELQYWTKALGVNAEELRAAVKAVGSYRSRSAQALGQVARGRACPSVNTAASGASIRPMSRGLAKRCRKGNGRSL